jgi:transcriptional regulator with XRE-family HTH domain
MKKTKKTDKGNARSGVESFGERLGRLMKAGGFTQSSLAAKVGIDRTQLNRTISGKRHPRTDELAWLAQGLDIPLEVLLDGIELGGPAREFIDREQEKAARVLRLEGERDEARALLKASEDARRLLEDEHGRELKRLATEAAAARDEAARRLTQVENAAVTREGTLRAELYTAKRSLAELQLVVTQLRATVQRHEAVSAQLRQQVAQERNGKEMAGILGAAAGIAVLALGASKG